MRPAVTIARVIRITAEWYGVPASDIVGHSRRSWFKVPRVVAMKVARECVPDATWDAIGAALGGRHHTTILQSVSKLNRHISELGPRVMGMGPRAELIADIEEITAAVMSGETTEQE